MKNIIYICAVAIILSACDNKAPDSTKTVENLNENTFGGMSIEKDVEFATKAAEGGMLEVQLGELALTNSSSEKVKEFARTMIKDHGTANEELKKMAQAKKIMLPAKLGDDKMKDYNELSAKKGIEFDRAYADYMVKDHEKDVKLFEEEASKGNDPELKKWAYDKVPTLQHHLRMAQDAQEAVK